MGRGRSYEIIEYRKKIFTELCSSNEILKLLRCEDEENPEDVLPYKASPIDCGPEIFLDMFKKRIIL